MQRVGTRHGLGAAVGVELAVEVTDVALERGLGDDQLGSHIPVGETSGQQAQDFALAQGERRTGRGCGGLRVREGGPQPLGFGVAGVAGEHSAQKFLHGRALVEEGAHKAAGAGQVQRPLEDVQRGLGLASGALGQRLKHEHAEAQGDEVGRGERLPGMRQVVEAPACRSFLQL